jgi:hypothetical protein
MQYILYHGSIKSFNCFDESKINSNETDALYNGFWFTSNKWASPAWRNPRYIKKCIITLNNPAPLDIIRKTIKELKNCYHEKYNSLPNAVRHELINLGYDGIIHNDFPIIDKEELYIAGKTEYFTARGNKYILKVDTELNGIDLFDQYDQFITGFCDLKDFMEIQERTIVVFKNEQIHIIEEVKQE